MDQLEAVGRALIIDGYVHGESVLTPGRPVWSGVNFAELKKVYVDQPDLSSDKTFFEKLSMQFSDASDGAIQLFAELLLTNVLPLSNYLGRTKVSHVQQVLDMMSDPVAIPDGVVAAVQVGAFNGGTAFGVRRWSQLQLLVNFGLHVNTLSNSEREKLGDEPMAFRSALAAVAAPNEPVQRAALRYLAYPKFFRPIVNATHRGLIRDAFASYLAGPASGDVDIDLDEISRALEAEQNGPIDYYSDRWKPIWQPAKLSSTATTDDADEDADDLIVAATEFQIADPDQELADSLHVDLDWLVRCVDLLRDRPQLIFYGPPGTGKTYIAKALARHLASDNGVKIVQFHPAYSYEDFFEGFRPAPQDGGHVAFELRPGPLRQLADRARKNPDELFVLIIDEINRGNLAKIFGELYFLLEYRNEAVDLMYSSQNDEPFYLPRNLLLIGTMNTADRSIALVDTAMRRRFAFVPLHPHQEPTRSMLRRWLEARNYPSKVADLHAALNAAIGDTDFQIGPSYFMRPAVHSEGGLTQVWDTAIVPLLEEFHFGDSTVNITARYSLAALEKAMMAGG